MDTALTPQYKSLSSCSFACRSYSAPEALSTKNFSTPFSIYCTQENGDKYIPSSSESTEDSEKSQLIKRQFKNTEADLIAQTKDIEVLNYNPSQCTEDIPILSEDGTIKNAGPFMQSLSAAQDTVSTLKKYGLNENALKEKLLLVVGHPQVGRDLPFYQTSAPKCIALSRDDHFLHPDVISHETGHAVLDSMYNYCYASPDTAAAHEACADSCAFITSIQDPEILWDILRSRAMGSISSRASCLGEFLGPYAHKGPIRDLAQPYLLTSNEKLNAYQKSLSFTSSLYKFMLCCEEAAHESLNSKLCAAVEVPDEIFMHIFNDRLPIRPFDYQCLSLAAQLTSRVFADSLNYLPDGPDLSLSDLTKALYRAAESYETDLKLHELLDMSFQEMPIF